jgi:hypothetical protein
LTSPVYLSTEEGSFETPVAVWHLTIPSLRVQFDNRCEPEHQMEIVQTLEAERDAASRHLFGRSIRRFVYGGFFDESSSFGNRTDTTKIDSHCE